LVQLFLHCDAPSSVSEFAFGDDTTSDGNDDNNDGRGDDWKYDGFLLDNGPILSPVTNFITNRMFGRGRKWLGKAYYLTPPKTTATTTTTTTTTATCASNDNNVDTIIGVGRNRFSHDNHHPTTQSVASNELLDRTFDYSIEKSALPSSLSTSSKSLFNRYASHCSLFSSLLSLLWRGMVDELRVVALLDNNDDDNNEGNSSSSTNNGNGVENQKRRVVLLGMGYFTWSGGVWNLAPFCLIARKCGGELDIE